MKAADTESTRGVLQVIEAIGLPAVLKTRTLASKKE